MTKFKRFAASITAVAALATSSIGGMTASAYSPTVTRSFNHNGVTVTGSLYNDSSYAYATTESNESLYKLTVSATRGGSTTYGYTEGGTYCSTKNTSGSGGATSHHYGYSSSATYGSTSITMY